MPTISGDTMAIAVGFPMLGLILKGFPGALLLLATVGCTSGQNPVAPYFVPMKLAEKPETAAESARPVPRQGPHNVSICYNGRTTTPEQISRMISDNCEGITFVKTEVDLGYCSLLAPSRALYRCERISAALAEEKPPLRPTLTR